MEQLINFIIRPSRAEYDPENDLLDQEFMLKGKWYKRKDLEVVNSQGDVLQCSHYMPMVCSEGIALPCVIYCHGNSGSRADASEAAIILLPSNVTVFTFDFSGSGLSGGEYVTLGWKEKDDLRAVLDFLRADENISLIGLWGRSMGAVSCLMYGAEDPSIAGMVLDSPFSDLIDLMMELVDSYKFRLLKFAVKLAIHYLRRAVMKKANFDIKNLNTIKVAKSCFVPVLIGHAVDDNFIQPHHSDRIFDAYMGEKNIIKFEEDELRSTLFDLSTKYFGEDKLSTAHDVEHANDLLVLPVGRAADSTEDAMKHLGSSIVVLADLLSEDKKLDAQEQDSGSGSRTLSSNMISFELSSGSVNSYHTPAFIDDGKSVEHRLGNATYFATSVGKEERMFMEAVFDSLKSLESDNHPLTQGNSFETLSTTSTSAANDHNLPIEFPPKSTSSFGAEIVETSPTNNTSTCKQSSCSASIVNYTESPVTSVKNVASFRSDALSDIDMADHTRVTIEVVKNPTRHIMDGLQRRWDLNFFRSRRS
ncbi:unnamed protein product [Fraxinus pennsylvanica]|uniref:Serine aminopeptidase S33 domain-containing protein n=1 Tax=Fraxinus pennsylvanica TaxID=56036 RepID=A0AAD1Z4J0_9LAMI|nr:unnamed protein product [Fraxinus pennsylvanica]